MKEDLISIVVPIYNVESYLGKCVESLVTQSYNNIEIILVDDGSPDNCSNICDDYAKKYDKIKVIHKKNGGLSDARNAGTRIAKGKYIVFVDSDDYVKPEMIEELYKAIKKDNSKISICNRLEHFEEKDKFKISFNSEVDYLLMNFEKAMQELCSFNLFDMSAWSKMYDIKLFSNIEFPVGKLSEDYYIMHKIFEKCDKIVYINKPLYIYNQRKGSISKNKKINYDYRLAAEEQMKYIEKKYPDLKKYVRTAYALSNMTIFNWYIKNRHTLPSKEETKELQKNVKDNIKFIKSNEKISKSRKIQSSLFITNKYIYSISFCLFKLIRG